MKKYIFLFLLSLITISSIKAQLDSTKNNQNKLKNIWSLHWDNNRNTYDQGSLFISSLKLTYEFKLHKEFVILIGYSNNIFYLPSINLRKYQTFNTSIRWYYNFNERVDKGKNTQNNSAEFINFGLNKIHYLPSLNFERGDVLYLQWGIRRTLYKRIFFEFAPSINLGLQKIEFIDKYPFYGTINLKLSKKLGKK